MKSKILILAFLLSCASTENSPSPEAPAVSAATMSSDLLSPYPEIRGCFLLYDLKNQKFLVENGTERCRERQTPCSTFKVPLAVMGFESGILKDESTLFKWDGKKQFLDDWNQDHTAATWMSQSVVWYSQKLTKKMGRKKIQSYLDQFEYGNKDFSGDISSAWLTPSPFSPDAKPSVAINAYEQIEFMKKLWTESLPASEQSQKRAQKIMWLEESPKGFQISGKTGSGYMDVKTHRRLAWFVAHIQKGNDEYLSVMTYNDIHPQDKPGFGSALAKQITKDILIQKGLY